MVVVKGLQERVAESYLRPLLYRPHKQALLVQQDETRKDDICLVAELLKIKEYKTQIIGVEECTKERVLSSIDQLAESSRKGSNTFFYYAGHGGLLGQDFNDGINVNGSNTDPCSMGIVPYELFERAKKIKGKKALLIDACLSGAFVEYLASSSRPLIKDYVVIASTLKEGLSFGGNIFTTIQDGDKIDTHPLLSDKIISPLVCWLYIVSIKNKRVNLSRIPLPSVTLPDEFLKKHPEIDLKRDGIMYRITDTNFVL